MSPLGCHDLGFRCSLEAFTRTPNSFPLTNPLEQTTKGGTYNSHFALTRFIGATSDMDVTRRTFLGGIAGVVALGATKASFAEDAYTMVAGVDHARILRDANLFLGEAPKTVTAAKSDRSSGGLHDYFSEGDYWWPDPKNPTGPYVRRDGFSNPGNFNTHREALIRFGLMGPALVSAWRLTKDKRYVAHFLTHIRAWCVDDATKMNPNLEYAQAIMGVSKGRGTGIIDTLQWTDLARGLRVMEATGGMSATEIAPVKAWFAAYVDWMATSKNGIEEELAANNHGACWVLQVAEFAQFAGRKDLVDLCRDRYKNHLIPDQVAKDGTLPLELARTKPYSYSLFDGDVLTGICQSLSTPKNNLWSFKGPKGAGVAEVMAMQYPVIADKSKWSYAKDVEYFDDFPSRRSSLLFAGYALGHPEYVNVWKKLDGSPTVPEVIRNLPIRQPLLWVEPAVHAM